jgi:hypothetical protein
VEEPFRRAGLEGDDSRVLTRAQFPAIAGSIRPIGRNA